MKTEERKYTVYGLIAIAGMLIMTIVITYNVVIFMGTVCKPKTELQK